MKTELKNLATLLAIAIYTNEEYDESEKESLSEIADALGLKEQDLPKEVEICLDTLKDYNEEQLNKRLDEVAALVAKEEVEQIFEAAIEMILADGIITNHEIENLLAIADSLKIEHARVVLMLLDLVKYDSDVIIEF